MDITFRTPEGRFNYRVCAVIIDGERLLAMKDERSPYYYLPGGRVSLHETAEDAVLREVREELGIDARIDRPLWLNQSIFTEDVTGERFHEICVYYLMDMTKTDLLTRGNRFDGAELCHRQRFTWLSFEEVEKAYLYPLFIKQRVRSLPQSVEMITEFE